MRCVMLIYEGAAQFDARARPEDDPHWSAWRSYHRALVEAGVYVGGSPLERSDTTATTLRVRGGERQVQAVQAHQPYWAVRAHFEQRLGHRSEAGSAFEHAIRLSEDQAVRRFLQRRSNAGQFAGPQRVPSTYPGSPGRAPKSGGGTR